MHAAGVVEWLCQLCHRKAGGCLRRQGGPEVLRVAGVVLRAWGVKGLVSRGGFGIPGATRQSTHLKP
jgi:hypothetical protein